MSKRKQELTPWFPRKTKPVRKGVYQVNGTPVGPNAYSYWDGRHWNGAWYWSATAQMQCGFFDWHKHEGACDAPRLEWRGLAKKP